MKFSTFCSKRIHHLTDARLLCEFREMWLTGNRQSRALFTSQKKTKFRLVLSLSLLRGLCPKSAGASGGQCSQSVPNVMQIVLQSYSRTREHRQNAP